MTSLDGWYDALNSHFKAAEYSSGASFTVAQRSANVNGGTVALGVGNDPGTRRTALLHAFAFQSADNEPCTFQVQGTVWTSP